MAKAFALPRCRLELVDLSENEVSDLGAERLAAVLPRCGQLRRPSATCPCGAWHAGSTWRGTAWAIEVR